MSVAESYVVSEEESLSAGDVHEIDSSDVSDGNYSYDLSDFEPENYGLDLHASSGDEKRPYIDRAYNGKFFEPVNGQRIKFEQGMLFGYADIF